MYKTAMRPAMLLGLEAVALMKRLEAGLQKMAELRMLRFSYHPMTRIDGIGNYYNRGSAQVRKSEG